MRFSRCVRAGVLAVALVCAGVSAARAGDAPGPLPSLSADEATMPPLDLPADCGVEFDLRVAESLGRTIDDDVSLRFIQGVRALSAVELENAGAVAIDPAVVARLAKATEKACTGALASVIATRAFAIAYATAPGGHLVMEKDDQEKLLGNLANAAGALATRDHLSTADVDAALAPFGTTLEALKSPPIALPAACIAGTNSPASLVNRVDLPGALSAGHDETGQVRVSVHVDEAGLVSYVRLHDSTLRTGSRLATASLIAAAASSYAAGLEDCHPKAGTYVFSTEYGP